MESGDSSNMLTGGPNPRSHRCGPPSQGEKRSPLGGRHKRNHTGTVHKRYKTSVASTSSGFQMRLQKFGCKALNGSSKVIMPVIATAARPCAAFYSVERVGGSVGPPAVRPLMDLELRRKNERVARNERKPIVSNFKVSGQPMTSEVTRSGPSDTTIFRALLSRPE